MKSEYDFTKGERGKFFRPSVELNIPIYLDPEIAEAVREHARKRKRNVGSLVNEWVRREFLVESSKRRIKAR